MYWLFIAVLIHDFCRFENQNTEEKVQAFNYFSTELLIIEHKTQEILHCVFEEVRTNLVLKQEMSKSAWKSKEKMEKQTHE